MTYLSKATKPKKYRGGKCIQLPRHGRPKVKIPAKRPEKVLGKDGVWRMYEWNEAKKEWRLAQ